MSDQTLADTPPRIRIGELSRRTGVQADTLRAWERRYGLLDPIRTDGGFRLYGPRDVERVRAMSALISSGLSAAEAAEEARHRGSGSSTMVSEPVGPSLERDAADRMLAALRAFDEAEANLIIDEVIAALSIDSVLGGVVLPVLEEIGDSWERREWSIAQEHFASSVIRGRLLGLGRNWGAGTGRLALLACPSGEQHDLGLLVFGLALRARGWRITYLGQDTPVETIRDAAAVLSPNVIVLATLDPAAAKSMAEEAIDLSNQFNLLFAGSGVDPALAQRAKAQLLEGGPVGAARELSSKLADLP